MTHLPAQSRFDDRLYQLHASGIEHQHFGFVSDNFIAHGFDIQHRLRSFSASCVPPGSRVNTMSATPSVFSVSITTLRLWFYRLLRVPNDNVFTAHFFSLSAFR